MKKYTFFSIFILLLLCATVFVHGQGFTGPGVNPLPPPEAGFIDPGTIGQPIMVSRVVAISEARNFPHDSWVVISGNIVNALPGGKNFMFRDSSGEIPVEIGPKEWRGLSVSVSDVVNIYGEVKIERRQVFIKVHAINAAAGPNVRRYAFTINEAQNLPHDSWVVLTGNIVNSLQSRNDFTFRDSSGEIIIDIGPKEWRGLSVGEMDRVEISGEVKINRAQPIKIKVHAIRKI